MRPEDIVSDAEVDLHHFGRFGPRATPRGIIDEGILKAAFGFDSGSTVREILRSHGLVRIGHKMRLTEKGLKYARAVYGGKLDQMQKAAGVGSAVWLVKR